MNMLIHLFLWGNGRINNRLYERGRKPHQLRKTRAVKTITTTMFIPGSFQQLIEWDKRVQNNLQIPEWASKTGEVSSLIYSWCLTHSSLRSSFVCSKIARANTEAFLAHSPSQISLESFADLGQRMNHIHSINNFTNNLFYTHKTKNVLPIGTVNHHSPS